MMGDLIEWPTRMPGQPYRWVLSLETERPSPRCVVHRASTGPHGVCDDCVSEWRRSLGVDPSSWVVCTECGLPLHPAAEAGGHRTCPSCDETAAAPAEEVFG